MKETRSATVLMFKAIVQIEWVFSALSDEAFNSWLSTLKCPSQYHPL